MPLPPERRLTGALLPSRLLDLPQPPAEIFLRGELPRGPAVAIVGTRHPSVEARGYALELAAELAREGVCILSGGAKGIDTAAHEGVLAIGGCTVVVAPAGFERPFPEENAELFRRIVAAGGAYLSLTRGEVGAGRAGFFLRNHCLVALAHVVVVVEAPVVSGARNTAKWARRLGRPLFVCGAPPWQPKGGGCILELRLGARPLFSTKDILEALAELRAHPVRMPRSLELFETGPAQRPNSTPSRSDAESVLEAIGAGAHTRDAVCARTGLAAARVQELVLTLTLDGVLVPDSAGRLSLASSQNH
jgi:DNA processing protein